MPCNKINGSRPSEFLISSNLKYVRISFLFILISFAAIPNGKLGLTHGLKEHWFLQDLLFLWAGCRESLSPSALKHKLQFNILLPSLILTYSCIKALCYYECQLHKKNVFFFFQETQTFSFFVLF